MTQHVPMCVMCGENEVGTFQAHDQFCGDMCADRAHDALEVDKFYAGWTEDEADYQTPVQPSGDAVYEMSWDDVAAQWDDDPSPYDGTYSEE